MQEFGFRGTFDRFGFSLSQLAFTLWLFVAFKLRKAIKSPFADFLILPNPL